MNVYSQISKQQKREIQESRNPSRSKYYIYLSTGRLEIFNRELHELDEAGSDTTRCSVSKETIRSLDGDLAAQILILIHNPRLQIG